MTHGRLRTNGRRALRAAALLLLIPLTLTSFAQSAGAEPLELASTYPDGTGSITIEQTPVGPTGLCLPAPFTLSYETRSTPTAFQLIITASRSLCQPIDAVAAIYAMPTNGQAWPQSLATRVPFTIPGPGRTTVTFTRGCQPAQFDVIQGDTPPVIAPWGPWHGPLLFPFALDTSEQWFGGACEGGPGGGCDEYTPSGVTVQPPAAAPGETVTVGGNGTPGTTVQILLRREGGPTLDLGVSVTVPDTGLWSIPVALPLDLEAGPWIVVARVVGCATEATAQLEVGGTPDEDPVPEGPTDPDGGDPLGEQASNPSTEAQSAAAERPLPPQAVAATSATARDGLNAPEQAKPAGLAFTGGEVRLPVLLGILSTSIGGLILLRRRRRATA